ncbi:MAG: TIGR01212 family radical SAM protein [Eubacteriales bacterium]|nr:TIGR01212 family radical SAM protein [Eubacteriales bacterium]
MYMKERFGGKVYRLALSSGCTCPNRENGSGGCIFCSEGGSGEFAQCAELSVSDQMKKAKELVSAKISKSFAGYMPYFQSFSNTYGDPDVLYEKFYEAVMEPDSVALSIATRPDCISDGMLIRLKELNNIKPVTVELGLQTASDDTAALINRGYELSIFEDTYERLTGAGLEVVIHVIAGLPGEDEEMSLDTVRYLAGLRRGEHPLGVKLQILQILKGTRLGRLYMENDGFLEEHPIKEYTLEEYASFLRKALEILPEDTVIHRMTGDPPKKLLISPLWTADKKKVMNFIKINV